MKALVLIVPPNARGCDCCRPDYAMPNGDVIRGFVAEDMAKAKRFTGAELAAEVWHSVANYFTLGPGAEAVTEASRNKTIERFATLPHYDEATE